MSSACAQIATLNRRSSTRSATGRRALAATRRQSPKRPLSSRTRSAPTQSARGARRWSDQSQSAVRAAKTSRRLFGPQLREQFRQFEPPLFVQPHDHYQRARVKPSYQAFVWLTVNLPIKWR